MGNGFIEEAVHVWDQGGVCELYTILSILLWTKNCSWKSILKKLSLHLLFKFLLKFLIEFSLFLYLYFYKLFVK